MFHRTVKRKIERREGNWEETGRKNFGKNYLNDLIQILINILF